MISNRDVSCKRRGVRHNDMVPHEAIMRHMAVRHKKIVIPDVSDSVPASGSTVQAYKFAEDVIASDFQMCRFALVFEILRVGSNGTVAVEMAPFSNIGPAININMGIQDAAGPYVRIRADNAVGPDMCFPGDLTGLIYDCCRMYGHGI